MRTKSSACARAMAVLACMAFCIPEASAKECPPGQVEGWLDCDNCTYGEYQTREDGKAVCKKCSLGTYAAQPGATSCKPCAPGWMTYYEGQSACEPCMVSHVPKYDTESGWPSCEPCPAGQYTPTEGSAPCKMCPLGSYISMDEYRAHSCKMCPPGYKGAGNTSRACYPDAWKWGCCDACAPGTIAPKPGSTECAACPVGTYQPGTNATACLPCPKGSYAPYPGAAYCSSTDLGHYQDKEGQSGQIRCPSGTIGLERGATSSESCLKYGSGRYSFGERQHSLAILRVYSFGTVYATEGVQTTPVRRVVDSGSTIACGGQVFDSESWYQCARYPYNGQLDKSVCTSQPTGKRLESACGRYAFYALPKGRFAWLIHRANSTSGDPMVCVLDPSSPEYEKAREVSCRYREEVQSNAYSGDYLVLSSIKSEDASVPATPTLAPATPAPTPTPTPAPKPQKPPTKPPGGTKAPTAGTPNPASGPTGTPRPPPKRRLQSSPPPHKAAGGGGNARGGRRSLARRGLS